MSDKGVAVLTALNRPVMVRLSLAVLTISGLMFLAVLYAVASPQGADAAAHSTRPGNPLVPVGGTSTATPCPEVWREVQSPPGGQGLNQLHDVAAIAAGSVWAVGQTGSVQNFHPLTEHWDGTQWSVVPGPNVTSGILYGIAAPAANDLWAAGFSGSEYSNQAAAPLIAHWTGSTWAVVSAPNTGRLHTELRSVSAVSSNNIWAAGYSTDGTPAGYAALIMHWNGTQWSIVPSPSPPGNPTMLEDIAAISASDAWAVGSYDEPATGRKLPVTMHWNGTQWSMTPCPINSGYEISQLRTVSAVSASDVWAAGETWLSYAGRPETYMVHWNGTQWSIVPGPNPGELGNRPSGVAAISGNDVWVVGEMDTNNSLLPLALHWNGASWDAVPVDSTYSFASLSNVAAVASNNVWAVGRYQSPTSNMNDPLVEHYYSFCVTPTATATSTHTPTITPTPTQCTTTGFADVPPGFTFYPYVTCMVSRGYISGYPCGGPGEPCNACNNPYFRYMAVVTRAQIAKMVANSAGFNDDPGPQVFEDVSPDNVFYAYVNRLANRGIMRGYACGGPGEPCGIENRPYFRPGASATRGQISQIAGDAAGFGEQHQEQTFEDVPSGSAFYIWVQRLASRNVMQGYPCGGLNPETGQGEPCGPQNRAYFRPGNTVTRGQSSKIVANTFFPNCQPPTATPTPTLPAAKIEIYPRR